MIPQPKDAIKYMEKKAIVPTEDWNQLKHGEHSHAFTVAHSFDCDILEDISGALLEAQKNGTTFETFKKEMMNNPKITKWGGGVDKGDDAAQAKYLNWRLQVMFETNMLTSYSAGRWRQQLRASTTRPYLMYQQIERKSKRKSHEAFHNLVLPFDDPFWETYYPPNGWFCGCYVQSLSESQAKAKGITPNKNLSVMINDAKVPEEWAYNVGLTSFAPNFQKYENLGKIKLPKKDKPGETESALKRVKDIYCDDVMKTRITAEEFSTLLLQIDRKTFKSLGIKYPIGVLSKSDLKLFEKMNIVIDPKIEVTDERLKHGQKDKNIAQKLNKREFKLLYKNINSPERIYIDKTVKNAYHFISKLNDENVVKAFFVNNKGVLILRTFGKIPADEYLNRMYIKIK